MFENLNFYPGLYLLVHTLNLIFIKLNLRFKIKQNNFISHVNIIYVVNSLKFKYSKNLAVPLLSIIIFFETIPVIIKFTTKYRSFKLVECCIIKFTIKEKKKLLFFLNEFFIYFIFMLNDFIKNITIYNNVNIVKLLSIKFILNLNYFINYNTIFSEFSVHKGYIEIYFKEEFYYFISRDITINYSRIFLNFFKKSSYYVR